MGRKDSRPNKLKDTVSPYLLQHANNPVEWYPWGKEALDRSKAEDRPIFLSIGYSTCHWCHVMERESFEDEEVAKGLNEVFVCIKVDREERPDLDAIYMKACTLATGRGGWPLTVCMTPDLEPFFLGTYIPKRGRWGSIGMIDLIQMVKERWASSREDILSTSTQIIDALGSILHKGPGADMDRSVIEECVERFKGSYDEANGGFDGAPKFPSPHQGMLLLRHWRRTKDEQVLNMVKGTLDHMMTGGIFDRVGGGFHRYSTDDAWRVPHFEKMLYDQAMMAMLLLEAYQATGETRYAKAARSTIAYVLNDLSDPHGGFHTAEDADSEGEEGKFYMWSIDELEKVLKQDESELLLSEFDLKREGNILGEGGGEGRGGNVLISKHGPDAGKDAPGPGWIGVENRIDSILRKLRSARDRRVRPAKDDKVLADWNGMMVSALAKASRVLGERSYSERARSAIAFILGTMRDREGRLLHRYREGDSDIDGFLEDHAYVIQGMLDLYEATFDPKLLSDALELNHTVMQEFLDEEHGGFFQTSARAEKVLFRTKDGYDGAIPSGNSVQMMNLLRLARIGGGISLIEAANAIGRSFSTEVARNPTGFCYMLCALDRAIGPSSEIIISGERTDPRTVQMIDHINTSFNPCIMTLLNEGGSLVGIVPDINDYPVVDGKTTAYVCTGSRCDLPITDPETLKLTLDYY